MVYLDHSATTPVAPSVVEAMIPWMAERFGNPSSLHGPGVEAASAIDEAARRVAALAGPGPWEVVFTSGGTESNALAVLGSVRGRSKRVVTTTIEHPSVLRNVSRLEDSSTEVVRIAPRPGGAVAAGDVVEAADDRTVLVSLMHGNNEIGTLQPVAEVASAIRARQPHVLIHVDAVQTAGKVPLADVLASADLVTLSAHKMHGPKGIGALLVRKGSKRPAPLFLGGDQQHGLRPGTENVPSIVGFGRASLLATRAAAGCGAAMEPLEAALLDALSDAPNCEPAFTGVERVPGHVALAVTKVPTEPVIHAMEARGIIVSSGSACHTRSPKRSHVLDAVGLPQEMDIVRVVASHDTTTEQMRRAGEALSEVLTEMSR